MQHFFCCCCKSLAVTAQVSWRLRKKKRVQSGITVVFVLKQISDGALAEKRRRCFSLGWPFVVVRQWGERSHDVLGNVAVWPKLSHFSQRRGWGEQGFVFLWVRMHASLDLFSFNSVLMIRHFSSIVIKTNCLNSFKTFLW